MRHDTIPETLLAWFAEHQRDLPWRKSYDPYHVWISEIMGQQTRMDRVVGYFNRWVERFPDVERLAAARQDEVLSLWEGLGYYRRALNLHAAAREIVRRHQGRIPEQREELLELPGIGPYTAAAILSLAFNQDVPVVDANVERLLSRLFDIDSPVKLPHNRAFIRRTMEEWLPPGSARLFNQAVMEFGALVCRPGSPGCATCVLASCCRSLRHRTVAKRPALPPRKSTVFIEMACGILVHHGRVLIQKRPETGVWPNLWEFPGGELEEGESPLGAVKREFLEETELVILPHAHLASVHHSYTRYRVTLHGFLARLAPGSSETPVLHAAQEHRWVTVDELDGFAFPTGHRQLIDAHLHRIREATQRSLVAGSPSSW